MTEARETKNHSQKNGCTIKKLVYCGKPNCSRCPHGPYIYFITKSKGKQTWHYQGRAS